MLDKTRITGLQANTMDPGLSNLPPAKMTTKTDESNAIFTRRATACGRLSYKITSLPARAFQPIATASSRSGFTTYADLRCPVSA